jgi:Xaa-Pro aminopeptidase
MLFSPGNGRESTFEAVVWESFNTSSLTDVKSISRQEFGKRLDKLSTQLESEGLDAFIAEPGGTTLYYTNISNNEWGLSERPFLLAVTPSEILFLTPLFEVSRAMMLPYPHPDKVKLVTWAEGMLSSFTRILRVDASPYQTLLDNLPPNATIMVDDNVRSFISQGLTDLNANVTPQSPSIASIREIKSSAEIDIIRAVRLSSFLQPISYI